VYTVLRLAILEQALGPGTKLPEDAIGERLGVSRTVVRRALEKLSAEELVKIEPNRGASVARPTIEEARDVFAVRTDLERLVIERICGKLEAEQFKTLEDWVANEERAFRDTSDDYIRQAAEFHVLLAEMAASPLLLKYIRSLVARSALILGLYGRPNWPSCNMDEHRAIIAALRAGDRERAWKVMRDHLDGVLHRALDSGIAEPGLSVIDVISNYAAVLESQ
jgi:DNA-binding GntR family transcriptional regulator